jgi:predicted RNase H-like HicB family nuclease
MAKEKKQFKVIIEQDEDGYFIASVPSLPGCYTQAKTLPELTKRIQEAISLCLEVAKIDSQYRKRIKQFASDPIFVGIETVRI